LRRIKRGRGKVGWEIGRGGEFGGFLAIFGRLAGDWRGWAACGFLEGIRGTGVGRKLILGRE